MFSHSCCFHHNYFVSFLTYSSYISHCWALSGHIVLYWHILLLFHTHLPCSFQFLYIFMHFTCYVFSSSVTYILMSQHTLYFPHLPFLFFSTFLFHISFCHTYLGATTHLHFSHLSFLFFITFLFSHFFLSYIS